jgi:cytochrome c-type biogenesis protein CcmH/NrfF
VFALSKLGWIKLAFLWLNPLGALLVVLLSVLLQVVTKKNRSEHGATFSD